MLTVKTDAESALRSICEYIDMIMDELADDQERHHVVNESIKHLRGYSIELNIKSTKLN